MREVAFIWRLMTEVHSRASVYCLFVILILILTSAILSVAQPYAFKLFLDSLTGDFVHEYNSVIILLLYVSFLGLARSMRYLYQPIFTRYTLALQRELGANSFSHMLKLPYHNLVSRDVHALPKILSDANIALHNLISAILEFLLPIIFEVAFILTIITFQFGPYVLFVSTLGILFFLTVTFFGSRIIQKFQNEYTVQGNRNFEIISESIANFETIRSFNCESVFINRYLIGWQRYNDLCRKFFTGSCAVGIAQLIVLTVAMFLLMSYVLESYQSQESTIGDIVLINMYALQLTIPLQNLAVAYRFWRQAIVELRIRDDVMSIPTEQNVGGNGDISYDYAPVIEFRNVSFKYKNAERYALHNVSFRLVGGRSLCIVGPSGSGKSTVIRLLLRYLDEYDGVILLNDIDIRNFGRESIRRYIGFVPQEVVLFDDDLSFNVSLEISDVDELKVLSALRYADATSIETDIRSRDVASAGNRGAKLSGGEKQRIGVARALYSSSKLMIFDEPTSALDNLTEAGFLETLRDITQDKSTILISHRMKIAETCDHVLVLDKGSCCRDWQT